MATKRGIIFDMDGTLVDNIPFHKNAWLLFLKSNNILIEDKNFNVPNHGTSSEMIIHFFGTDLPAETIEELGQEKE
ncbi:MAG: hypothetical protein LBL62_06870, partial [Planctomycetaceae bacterium]|nr:hypothetical protein [Planctomycetaceae bacterium]